jgi:lipopolysaccharide export system permease protein
MQFLWKYIDDLVGKGLEWYIIVELLFYASSTFVPMALPLAILLSSLMTFGNLGENYELVAMKAAGISLRKIMVPLIVVSIVISIIAFYFSNNIYPIANLKFKALLYDVREQKLALDIKDGVFYKDLDGFVIRVGKKEKDGKRIKDVIIYDHRNRKGNNNVTTADSGIMEMTPDGRYLLFTLFNGVNYLDKTDQRKYRETRPFQRTKFKKEIRKFDMMDFEMTRTNEDLFKDNYSMLNITQLKKAEDSLLKIRKKRSEEIPVNLMKNFHFFQQIDSAKLAETTFETPFKINLLEDLNKYQKIEIIDGALNRIRRIRSNISGYKTEMEIKDKLIFKHQAEWHRKFTLSVACFVLFFIGAPLGAIIRKGGLGLPVVVSVLFFVLFHIISITGEKSVRSGVIDANIGMWIAPVILLPLGIFLTYKATTDSPLLDSESWIKFFGKFLKKKPETL